MRTSISFFLKISALLVFLSIGPASPQAFAQTVYTPYTFTTLSGNAGPGSADGTTTAGRFTFPMGVAVDSTGTLYVADTLNNNIRKVTAAGVVTTLAGLANPYSESKDGTGTVARFSFPSGLTVDITGTVYVADTGKNLIRKVTSAGVVTTLPQLGGGYAAGVAIDSAGTIYVADFSGHRIQKWTLSGGWTTLAGLTGSQGSADGTGSVAQFSYPSSVAVDSATNIYVADSINSTIRKVTPAGVVTTLAGLAGSSGSADGSGTNARFWFPQGVAVDSAGNIYVADSENATIRKVTQAGFVTTLAGMAGLQNSGSLDGTGTNARFRLPEALSVDSLGNVYVADSGNNEVRKVTAAGVVTTLGGQAVSSGNADGTASAARFNAPSGIAVDSYDNLVVGDTGNNTIRHGYPAVIIVTSEPGFGFGGGQFGFTLSGPRGPPGPLVVVEASSDLLTWLPIWTNSFSGTLNFSESAISPFSHRFYRAALP